jgi:hypothetical protein
MRLDLGKPYGKEALSMSIPRRSFLALIGVAGLLVASAVLASGAAAVPGQGSATPFKASYNSGATHWECSGARIVNSNTGTVKDSETCLLSGDTTSLVAGTYTGDPYGTVFGLPNPVRWKSDYDGAIATTWTSTFLDNSDGTWTVNAVAYY